MDVFLQTLAKSIALGSIYAIMGLSFVLIFKATQVLNFAAGAISMAGAVMLSILIADGGLPFLPFDNPFAPDSGETAGIPLWLLHLAITMVLAAVLGLLIERIAIRPMVGQPLFALAVITLGIEIAIRPFNLDAVAISGRSLGIPWKTETWEVAGAIVPKSYLAAVLAAAVSFGFVFWFYRTRFGVAMRAAAFDQEAAMAQGISIEIHPIWVFRVLPVIILGGLDSVVGVLYGGLIIATFEIFAGQYLSQWNSILGSGYSTVVPYLVMLVVLLVRPYGLFGTEEIRRV
jgi:branched-chain amino acid transport system permease protein